MGSRTRLFAALTLVVMPVTSGVVASPSFAAEAVSAKGGCWAYGVAGVAADAPSAEVVDQSAAAAADPSLARLSEGLLADGAAPGLPQSAQVGWSPSADGAELLLSSGGASAVGGKRTFTLTLDQGPALQRSAVPASPNTKITGQAHAVLLVHGPDSRPGDVPQRVFATASFEAEEGTPLQGLTFTSTDGLDLALDGQHTVVLQSVYFVAPAVAPAASPQMWVCNAQTETRGSSDSTIVDGAVVPGANPLTAPLSFDGVNTSFGVQSVSTLGVARVKGQVWAASARPGDTVVLYATGADSDADVRAAFGPAGGPYVQASEPIRTDADGNVLTETEVVVPASAPVGRGVMTLVRASDGVATGTPIELNVLAAPSLEVTEKVRNGFLSLSVTGRGFDPYTEVRLRGRDGDAKAGAMESVTADANGSFRHVYEVFDPEASSLRAAQTRAHGFGELSAEHVIETEFPTAGGSGNGNGGDGSGNGGSQNGSGNDSSTPQAIAPPAAAVPAAPVKPPVQIPLPAPSPIAEIPAPDTSEPLASELKVSEVRLEGSPDAAELFGGKSQRKVAFEVENVGEGASQAQPVLFGVGRSTDAEPGLVATELEPLQPGARVAVAVDVALPMASFGTYQVVGRIGDDVATDFDVRWDTYPWGLIGVNVAGAGLLAWGVSRRRRQAAPLPTGPTLEEAGASVVDLAALDKWWQEGKVVHSTPVAEDDNDSVVDLDAADRWWARNKDKVS